MEYTIVSAKLSLPALGSTQDCHVFVRDERGEELQFLISYDGEILDSGELETIPPALEKAVQTRAKEAFTSNPNPPNTLENLLCSTELFFKRHWPANLSEKEIPHWETVESDNTKAHLFCLVKDKRVSFIGERCPEVNLDDGLMSLEFFNDDAYLAPALSRFLESRLQI